MAEEDTQAVDQSSPEDAGTGSPEGEPQAGAADEGGEPQEPDLQNLLAEEQQRNAKLERDLSSIRGELRTQRDRDGAFIDQLNALGAKVTALGRAQQTGETETVLNEMSQIDESYAATQAHRRFEEQANLAANRFIEALKDPDGNQILGRDAPELSEALQLFNEGWNGEGAFQERLSKLSDAAYLAIQATSSHLYQQSVSAQRQARESAQEQRLQEGDLDTGTASVSGQRDDRDWWDNFAPTMAMTPENLKRAREIQQKIERGEL